VLSVNPPFAKGENPPNKANLPAGRQVRQPANAPIRKKKI